MSKEERGELEVSPRETKHTENEALTACAIEKQVPAFKTPSSPPESHPGASSVALAGTVFKHWHVCCSGN